MGNHKLSKLSAAALAVGVFMPDIGLAAPIPLGDPSFENFVVPVAIGYAYSDTYRPTSAWVDDLDHNSSYYFQDDGNSNWLYHSSYAELAGTGRRRPSPRTGNQAMHGFGYYNAQETSAVFEAQRTYSFSVWAQGDEDATLNRSFLFLYLFDGSIPFSEANSLKSARYAPATGNFLNRPIGASAEISKGLWTEISLVYTVQPGAPEIGQPVGVGFFIGSDVAIDDATLSVDTVPVPEPGATGLLCLGGLALLRRTRRHKDHGP